MKNKINKTKNSKESLENRKVPECFLISPNDWRILLTTKRAPKPFMISIDYNGTLRLLGRAVLPFNYLSPGHCIFLSEKGVKEFALYNNGLKRIKTMAEVIKDKIRL